LRLNGGIQGWASVSKAKEKSAPKTKRQARVEKGRVIKDMKKKFKASSKRKSKRTRRPQSRDDATALAAANERDASRSAPPPALPAPARSAGWTASEEDSALEILESDGNRVPVHPAKGLHWMDGDRPVTAP
jgi:hypothetical protein